MLVAFYSPCPLTVPFIQKAYIKWHRKRYDNIDLLSHHNYIKLFHYRKHLCIKKDPQVTASSWLRGLDLNQRPFGYEPNELPDCSTPRYFNDSCARLAHEPSQRRSYQTALPRDIVHIISRARTSVKH